MQFIEFFRQTQRTVKNLLGLRVAPTIANKTSYNSMSSVDAYAHCIYLKKPEKTIIKILKTKPTFGIMLDVGVGGGRTAPYFSELCERYIGVDYCENMVNVCRKKFSNSPNLSFTVADARSLSIYADNSFGFVLFSHGGLDAVEHEDRIKILSEIGRVVKNGGYFCFSTSNLDAMLQYCRFSFSNNPQTLAKNLVKLLLIRLINPEMWKYVRGKKKDLQHTMFNVGGDNWSLKTYCVTPEAQLTQLKNAGFTNTRIFDMQGKETPHLYNKTDVELYFLCQKETKNDSF